MGTTVNIRGVPVKFPFEPYDIQVNYMEKVLECLQTEQHGVLESPTGTGKTLSLLCSAMAWLESKRTQIRAQRANGATQADFEDELSIISSHTGNNFRQEDAGRSFGGLPTIIYASRTHSQLSQAMRELKRSAYKDMRATILGSRDQLCIHSDILQEPNSSMKRYLCNNKVQYRTCHFYNRVERMKDSPFVQGAPIVDIEDLVRLGQEHAFCPYYMSKSLTQHADIIFMPYNYLLDPVIRKSLGIQLYGNVVILDEGHNIEKMCEESASFDLKSTDLTMCIEEVTELMKYFEQLVGSDSELLSTNKDSKDPKKLDFTAKELCTLKECLLKFEKQIDGLTLNTSADAITVFEGTHMFEMLQQSDVHGENYNSLISTIEKGVLYLSAVNNGPFQRTGKGLQLFSDLLSVVFIGNDVNTFYDKVKRCYKINVRLEETGGSKKGLSTWVTKTNPKKGGRVLSYWCFSPGFGMNMLMQQNFRSLILTSGTLTPLPPLISELELDVGVQLVNPHIVSNEQICVKIVEKGPDEEPLNCNYQNRSNPRYMTSLGRAIVNTVRMIPGGVLIFFPSYPILYACRDFWQQCTIWPDLLNIKSIYVEPKEKGAFEAAMKEYYGKIRDPKIQSAIFMGVCRGKVSEGMDFNDLNGRAVFVVGLPFPPLRDPRIILKKRYMDSCNSMDRQYLKGDEWYTLEATRAVNQAIGRVIRHRYDYGSIILMDVRFNSPRIRSQLSQWLRDRVQVVGHFGEVIRDLKRFYQNASEKFPVRQTVKGNATCTFGNAEQAAANVGELLERYSAREPGAVGPSGMSSLDDGTKSSSAAVKAGSGHIAKRRKIVLLKTNNTLTSGNGSSESFGRSMTTLALKEYVIMVQQQMDSDSFKQLIAAVTTYKRDNNISQLTDSLSEIFRSKPNQRYLIRGLSIIIKANHKQAFEDFCQIFA